MRIFTEKTNCDYCWHFTYSFSGGSASNDFSFFKPPALDVQPIVGNQESVIDSVQLLPTVDNVQSLPTVDSVQSSPVVERVQSLPTVLGTSSFLLLWLLG